MDKGKGHRFLLCQQNLGVLLRARRKWKWLSLSKWRTCLDGRKRMGNQEEKIKGWR